MSRDRTLSDTFYVKFTTRAFATGIPTTLAGTPVVSAYEDANLVQITAGITLTVDYDGVTGLNHLAIVASSGNGFETGKDYSLVITTGTVDSVSVVGEVVGEFSLGLSAAAVDLANGTDGLGAIKSDTAEIGVAGAGLTNIDLPNQTMDITGNLSGSVGSVTGSVGSVVGHTAQTGDNYARLGAPAGASVSADVAAVKSDTTAILIDTGTTLDGRIPAALVGGKMDSNVGAISADTIAADNLELDYDGTGYAKANSTIGTTTTNTDMRGTDSAALATVATEARLAELDAANIPADVDNILLDTGELQTDDVPGLIAALNDITAGSVWAVDATTQQTQGTFGQAIGDPVADTTTIYQSVATDATGDNVAVDVTAVKAETALIVADTDELQTDDVPGLIAALNNIANSDVLTQVNAALDTAITELGVAAPTATPTLRTGLMLLYMMTRNKLVVQTSGTDAIEVYNNAGTKIAAKAIADDGADYTESEMV